MHRINIRDSFKNDWISREAGERLRQMIVKSTAEGEVVEVDFQDMIIASTSFFDEGFAKLTELGWTKGKLHSLVRLKHIHEQDRGLLEKMCENRDMK